MVMGLQTALQLGKKLAEYFVYYSGEAEDYVALTDRLRIARTVRELMQSVEALLSAGEHFQPAQEVGIRPNEIAALYHFFCNGDKLAVSRFRAKLIADISMFELEKIQEQERYLRDLLNL